jgi:hypothetical protein
MLLSYSGMKYISESSKVFQKSFFKVFKEDFVQIPTQRSRILCFHPDGPVMHLDTHQGREASNSRRLHPSGRHGHTSGCSSKFKKIPTILCRHGLGRQLAFAWTSGQHRLEAEILDNEIACRHSASFRPRSCSESRATPSGCGLNMEIETHEAHYEKLVAQKTDSI